MEPNELGQSPLHYAAENGNAAFLDLVAAQPGAPACLHAGAGGQAAAAAAGERVPLPWTRASTAGRRTHTRAHFAPACPDAWPAGVDVDARANGERTPLIFTCHNSHTEAARVLLDRGADVNHMDASGLTPLH